jgi:hypothetical protein
VLAGVEGVHCVFVQGGRESDCGSAQHKWLQECGARGPGSYEVCVIGISNGVHGRVRSSDGIKGVLKHQCEEEGPEGVSLRCSKYFGVICGNIGTMHLIQRLRTT